MNTLGTFTIIRGKGACNVMVNGELNKEVARINELHEEEMMNVKKELKQTKDRMRRIPIDIFEQERRAKRMINLRYPLYGRWNVFHAIKESIVCIWACIWTLGIRHGVWGYWDDEEQAEAMKAFGRRSDKR